MYIPVAAAGTRVESGSDTMVQSIEEAIWYWYDDSSYRVAKLSSEVLEAILDRVQSSPQWTVKDTIEAF